MFCMHLRLVDMLDFVIDFYLICVYDVGKHIHMPENTHVENLHLKFHACFAHFFSLHYIRQNVSSQHDDSDYAKSSRTIIRIEIV